MMNFLKNYGSVKGEGVLSSLTNAIVAWDPEGATEAGIREIEDRFNDVNIEFSKLKQAYLKEKKEADEVVSLYNKRLAAAEHLQTQLIATPDNTQLTEALSSLVATLEEMESDVQREQDEATEAKVDMDEMEELVRMYADKLKTARKTMERAQKDLDKANRDMDKAKQREEHAKMVAGISTGSSELSVALGAMNKMAEEAKAKADASSRKASLLMPTKVEDNDLVKQAMDAVSGVSPSPTSLADRLSRLKK